LLSPKALEYFPASQKLHPSSEDIPTNDEYIPAEQGVHAEDELAPSIVEYDPAGQSMQSDSETELFPAMHSVQFKNSSEKYVPGEQVVQFKLEAFDSFKLLQLEPTFSMKMIDEIKIMR
jgi:hypothetical protein